MGLNALKSERQSHNVGNFRLQITWREKGRPEKEKKTTAIAETYQLSPS